MLKKTAYIGLLLVIFGFNYKDKTLDIYVLNDPITKTVVFRVINLDTMSYYIPNDSWLSNIGDTLYIEAIYKRRDESYDIISYNEFKPPLLIEIKPGSVFVRKISYKTLNINISPNVAIRVFTKAFPYNYDKDYTNYHSRDAFTEYEESSSFLLYIKVDKLDNIKEWVRVK